jgi:hypothetical protein
VYVRVRGWGCGSLKIATLTDQLKAKDIWAKSQEAEVRRLLGVQGNTSPAAAADNPTTYVRKS